jgi:carboxylesterase type B
MSIALHMVTNGGNTEGLFHGAFMESGAVLPRGDISIGQHDYDDLVRETGCAGAEDTLDCLRQLPFAMFKEAMDTFPRTISYRVCHDFLDPLNSVANYVPVGTELCLGPEGGWNIPQTPTATVGIAGWRC